MSKKTRKKIVRRNPASASGPGAAVAESTAAVKPAPRVMPAAGKAYLSSEDLDRRYQYVKDDLKHIAVIAIPLIFILILSAFFIKI